MNDFAAQADRIVELKNRRDERIRSLRLSMGKTLAALRDEYHDKISELHVMTDSQEELIERAYRADLRREGLAP